METNNCCTTVKPLQVPVMVVWRRAPSFLSHGPGVFSASKVLSGLSSVVTGRLQVHQLISGKLTSRLWAGLVLLTIKDKIIYKESRIEILCVLTMLRMNSTIHYYRVYSYNIGCRQCSIQLLAAHKCVNLPNNYGLKKRFSLDWSLALFCQQLTGLEKKRSSNAVFFQECDGLVLGM